MASKRRAYPSLNYQTDAPAPIAGGIPQPGFNGAAAVPVNGAYAGYTTGGNGAVDDLNQGIAGMNINQQPHHHNNAPVYPDPTSAYGAGQIPAVGGSPYDAYGAAGAGVAAPAVGGGFQQQGNQYQYQYGQSDANGINYSQSAPALPMNQLYNIDLLKELPPPIADLQFPPPPIILPSGTTLTDAPDANAAPEYFRSTLNVVPTTSSLLKKTKLPFALVIRPYLSLHDKERPVPVVDDSIISRCRRCRCYINTFVTFVENGRRWKCNLCGLQNDVPNGFNINSLTSAPLDKMNRNELNYSVVEFIAPQEYMVRAPQPLVYVFVLDVSAASVQNGLLATVTRTILESLDRIPDKLGRAKVAFLAVDSSLSFFSIPTDEQEDKEVSMMIVSDLDDVLIPSPDDLLVNLKDCRKNIENLLNNFTDYFANNTSRDSALGPALKSAHQLISSIGGKVVCFSSTLPNVGIGKLSIRDESSVAGKQKEAATLLASNNSFYKSFAVECNKCQITVDMFLTGSSYQDVATLSNLPRFTAGQTHFYPAWSANKTADIAKLTKEISNHLSMEIALEAVLRVRGSSGLRMSSFFGNFFNRSSDLCSFPTFPRDQSYVIEVSIDDYISKPSISFQAAVLHTTCSGERRIRVMTLGLPTSKEMKDIYASADQLAITNYFTHRAIEKTFNSSLIDAREYLTKSLVEILTTYKKELVAGNVGSSSPVQLCANLRMLPLLLHSLTKHIGFRNGKVPSDHRSAALNKLGSLPLNKLINYIYPSVYALHSMTDDCGLPFDQEDDFESIPPKKYGEIVIPESINATSLVLERYGLYLINNTSELFLWIGGDAVPQLVNDVFGVPDLTNIQIGKFELPELDNEFNVRIRNIINKLRESEEQISYESLYIIRGPSSNENAFDPSQNMEVLPLRLWCMSDLVEDRAEGSLSYKEFLSQLREKISN